VSAVVPILLLGLAGIFVGGMVSLRRNGASKGPIIALGVLAAIAAVAGVLWLLPEG